MLPKDQYTLIEHSSYFKVYFNKILYVYVTKFAKTAHFDIIACTLLLLLNNAVTLDILYKKCSYIAIIL